MPNIGFYFRGTQEEANAKRAALASQAEALGLKLVDYLEQLASGELVAVRAEEAGRDPEEMGLLELLDRAAQQLDGSLAGELARRRQALLEALS